MGDPTFTDGTARALCHDSTTCPVVPKIRGCDPEVKNDLIETAGCTFRKTSHTRGNGVRQSLRIAQIEGVLCDFECACSCAADPNCVSFDCRGENRHCRLFST